MISLNGDEMLVWWDTETFGLDIQRDLCIEIGVMITDLDLNLIGTNSWLLWNSRHDARLRALCNDAERGEPGAKFVLEMHTNNHLLKEAARFGRDHRQVGEETVQFLKTYNATGLPMTGSNVQFDRKVAAAHLPSVEAACHYRNIDISTVKELCRRYAPTVYANKPEKKEYHRTVPDLRESIEEFKYYKENFLNVKI